VADSIGAADARHDASVIGSATGPRAKWSRAKRDARMGCAKRGRAKWGSPFSGVGRAKWARNGAAPFSEWGRKLRGVGHYRVRRDAISPFQSVRYRDSGETSPILPTLRSPRAAPTNGAAPFPLRGNRLPEVAQAAPFTICRLHAVHGCMAACSFGTISSRHGSAEKKSAATSWVRCGA
jgi:hypothetical protein